MDSGRRQRRGLADRQRQPRDARLQHRLHLYKLSDSPPGAEYDVEADFTFISNTGSFNAHYLCGRLIDANNFYFAGYRDEATMAQRWFMGKYQGLLRIDMEGGMRQLAGV